MLPAEQDAAWQAQAKRIAQEADRRRARAEYDTGSITEFEAYLLRALVEFFKARIVIEVGTFIGTSACALASGSTVDTVYTCDISNNCFRGGSGITTFPKVSSTVMLQELVGRGVRADFGFFDGVLCDEDVELLGETTTPDPVFAVHDYNYGPKMRKHGLQTMPRKGIGNALLLRQKWPSLVTIEPLPDTTLAVLVPESRL